MSRRTLPFPGLNSCERIRPERPRNPIQKLVWGPGSQFQVGHIGAPEDEGSNPRMALRRLLRLYEGRQYREAAAFLMKLPHYTLKAALPDIPVDLLIETLPHSLALLEALYSRLAELNVADAKILRAEQLLWRIVHLISTSQDHFRLRIWSKLLVSLNRVAPGTRSTLIAKRRALERAVEGLGKHGLVPSSQNNTSENSTAPNLIPLPIALKEELDTRTEAYKLALHKIESFGKHAGTHKADQGVQAASHQRQLSLKYSEIQQRLIDNQSLLNTLEKAGSLRSLEELLEELKRRVEQDKEALRQWTALRKSTVGVNTKNPALAARLLQFSRGCGLALQLMSEDNPQAFLDEHVGDDYEEESSSAGYHTDESCSPTPEPVATIDSPVFNDGAGGDGDADGDGDESFPNPGDGGELPTVERLAERYGALYAEAHLHTLDALDALEPLKDAPDLKCKILYSVVVLSWRLAGMIQTSRRLEALKILNGTVNCSQTTSELEECIKRQLATSGAQTGSREVAEQVVGQLERTLYDFPCLRGCAEIRNYAASCASLAWACLARPTPLVLDVAQGTEFRRDVHARHHASPDANGTRIKAVLWPGLREGCQVLANCRGEKCGHEQLVRCARPLERINSNDLSFISKKEELQQLCPNLEDGMRCIQRYTMMCMKDKQREHFNSLYTDTNMAIMELCQEGPYQDEFLRHAPCMQKVKAEYEVCYKSYQNITQEIEKGNIPTTGPNGSLKSLCCAFQEYLDCSHRTVRRQCGDDTAKFTKEFLDRMSNSLLKMHCGPYTHQECSGMSGAASFRGQALVPVVLLFLGRYFT